MGYLSLCRRVPRAAGDSHVPRVEPGWGGGNRFFPRAALHHDEWRVAGPWGLHELCVPLGSSVVLAFVQGAPGPLHPSGGLLPGTASPGGPARSRDLAGGELLDACHPERRRCRARRLPPRVSCPSRVDPTSRASFGGTEASSPLERLPALGLRCQ